MDASEISRLMAVAQAARAFIAVDAIEGEAFDGVWAVAKDNLRAALAALAAEEPR